MVSSVSHYRQTKFACYASYFTMSSIFSLPPLLFVTLREMYGISYTLLGTLVLTNFCTQLAVDLLFTFFAKRFSPQKIVRVMPLVTTLGLAVYALVPIFFPHLAYGGLLLGTVIFSVAAGLSEVLLSPTIAAIPSENPQRDMSLLHSLYAFGVFSVVVISTLFLKIFGSHNWMYLTLFLAALPILPAVLFMRSPMPDMSGHDPAPGSESSKRRNIGLALCVACIFFGSCAENGMSNWISSYMENALHISKTVGDILGMAMFAILLGLVRIGYARFGKSIAPLLMVGMLGAIPCYLVACFATHPVPALIACVLTGVFTSMLWPGTLILMEERIPGAGVTAFALMAAGGDLGASVSPQLMGVVIDKVAAHPLAARLSTDLGLSPEQLGMKVGMLACAIFPVLGVITLLLLFRFFRKHNRDLHGPLQT